MLGSHLIHLICIIRQNHYTNTPVLDDSLHDVIGGQAVAAVQDAENPSLLRLLTRN